MIIDQLSQLPPGLLPSCRTMPFPSRLLMCPPEHFDVIDVKNPHMKGQVGRVDRGLAQRQWDELKRAIQACGVGIETIAPVAGCEDMVFCANQTFVGLDAAGSRICLLSQMRHPSRQREVPAFADWFAQHGYRVVAAPAVAMFEGSGDAIWHPGRGLIWGGYGHRSAAEAYGTVAATFDAPVIRLKLLSERFYHLDTCFCAIDERTVLIDPSSFEPRGLQLIRGVFERVIECPPAEAGSGMACNAAALLGKRVVIQRGNPLTTARLRELGYEVHEVETGEFLKSGGSVFCMKMLLF